MNSPPQPGLKPVGPARQRGRAAIRMAVLAPALAAVAAAAWGLAPAAPAKPAISAEDTAAHQARMQQEAAAKVRMLIDRQQFIAEISEAAFGDEEPTAPAEAPVRLADAATITGLIAEPPSLAGLEAAQIERIGQLTATAETRAAAAERTIRRAGLSPRLVAARFDDRAAQGGPLLSRAAGMALDPRLEALAGAAARMSALEQGLATIPTQTPASLGVVSVSSGFGHRHDPFTGEGAMHAGLDFRGPIGAPILAAADGRVTFAGVKSGYGNTVEVTHGNGMMTRYAHLSAFKARVGQEVAAGETIALLGNTGRSTGPHLHFEVRIDGAAVNPRRFLEAAS